MQSSFETNIKVNCFVNTIYDKTGNKTNSFQINPCNGKICIEYNNKKGCFIKEGKDEVTKRYLYDDLVSVNPDSPSSISAFFQRYGFFYSMAEDKPVTISQDYVKNIFKRISHIDMLFKKLLFKNILDTKNFDLIQSCASLLTTPILSRKNFYNSIPKTDSTHSFYLFYKKCFEITKEKEIQIPSNFEEAFPDVEIKDDLSPIDFQDPMVFCIPFCERNEECNYDDYHDSHYIKIADTYTKKTSIIHFLSLLIRLDSKNALEYMPLLMYCTSGSVETTCKHIVDFIYHLHWDYGKNLLLWEQFSESEQEEINKIISQDAELESLLLTIVRETLQSEYRYFTNNVILKLDVDTMQNTCYIPDLLAAIMISLSTIASQDTMLRECKWCHKKFIVSKTNSKKIYCSNICSNKQRQQRFQYKKL